MPTKTTNTIKKNILTQVNPITKDIITYAHLNEWFTIWLLDSRINGAKKILGSHADNRLGRILQSYGGKITKNLVGGGELPDSVLILNDLRGVCVFNVFDGGSKTRRHKHKRKSKNQRFWFNIIYESLKYIKGNVTIFPVLTIGKISKHWNYCETQNLSRI